MLVTFSGVLVSISRPTWVYVRILTLCRSHTASSRYSGNTGVSRRIALPSTQADQASLLSRSVQVPSRVTLVFHYLARRSRVYRGRVRSIRPSQWIDMRSLHGGLPSKSRFHRIHRQSRKLASYSLCRLSLTKLYRMRQATVDTAATATGKST